MSHNFNQIDFRTPSDMVNDGKSSPISLQPHPKSKPIYFLPTATANSFLFYVKHFKQC